MMGVESGHTVKIMSRFILEKNPCFCDDETAEMCVRYTKGELSKKEVAQLNLKIIEHFESNNKRLNEIALSFLDLVSRRSDYALDSEFLTELCCDDYRYPPLNIKLLALFQTNIQAIYAYCSFWKMPFVKTLAESVHSVGSTPKELVKANNLTFKEVKDIFEFARPQHWQDWIPSAAELVDLCDYLGINVEPLDKSPSDWGVCEYDMESLSRKHNEEDCKKFARLFSKHPAEWFSKWMRKFV